MTEWSKLCTNLFFTWLWVMATSGRCKPNGPMAHLSKLVLSKPTPKLWIG